MKRQEKCCTSKVRENSTQHLISGRAADARWRTYCSSECRAKVLRYVVEATGTDYRRMSGADLGLSKSPRMSYD